ncbi:vesicle-associated membrane protein 4-like [Biomphalaria glabrata]|nr:vesicle-associated membrane protein 4-like [Biomphalaria glabrata]XP_055898784.1 vesicle-associated membrane protein 4-like [Biomphalaria glabrata]XP_055898785.1 vesicle-associated membrane protein 4-like [Biomphalaria glabrata]
MPPKFARIPDGSDRAGSQEAERRGLLDGNSDDEDFFLKGPRVNTDKLKSDPKINRLHGQVEEVVDIMKSNVNKVIERGDRLEDLQDKSESLSSHSDMFRTRSKNLHKAMWWKNCRMKLIIAGVVVVIITIIVIIIVVQYSGSS